MSKPQIHIARPADRTLPAYQVWVRDVCHALNPDAADDLTPAEWQAAWQAFWAAAGQHQNEVNRA
jgi:hypothetical protein